MAGLGTSPGNVTINGAVVVFNQCCTAPVNFWRSMSNLTIDLRTDGWAAIEVADVSYPPAT